MKLSMKLVGILAMLIIVLLAAVPAGAATSGAAGGAVGETGAAAAPAVPLGGFVETAARLLRYSEAISVRMIRGLCPGGGVGSDERISAMMPGHTLRAASNVNCASTCS